jgi:hypothetical protein
MSPGKDSFQIDMTVKNNPEFYPRKVDDAETDGKDVNGNYLILKATNS